MIDIFVINLKNRIDKLNDFKKKFEKYFNINVVEAIIDDIGWKGCLYSHLKCIRLAKEKNLKYIIVFEDDACSLHENWFENFMKIKEEIFDKKDDWDIFIGGSTRTLRMNKITVYNKYLNLYNVCMTRNTHSIVYNNTSYDFFLNSDVSEPIDIMWYKKVKCIMAIPFLFSCTDYFSDISGEYHNISDRIVKNEKLLLENL